MRDADYIISLVIFGSVLFFLVVACSDSNYERPKEVVYPIYEIGTSKTIPDSLRDDMAKWITETVRASSQHMSGGDYEDPEDVLEEAEEVAERLFTRDTEGLYTKTCSDCFFEFTPYSNLNKDQKEVFQSLK